MTPHRTNWIRRDTLQRCPPAWRGLMAALGTAIHARDGRVAGPVVKNFALIAGLSGVVHVLVTS